MKNSAVKIKRDTSTEDEGRSPRQIFLPEQIVAPSILIGEGRCFHRLAALIASPDFLNKV
jgi:hypothetical protein